ncbi:hypothetical protein K523DRAFT_119737 [Schizophyllum commune Tattone D]|nr:hypothetical protein K523DRAFT_119737 [Schizophyllum commune Tattone D]
MRFVSTQLKHWTKLKIIDGDLVHVCPLARRNDNSVDSRDATYAQYTLDIDKYREQPIREPDSYDECSNSSSSLHLRLPSTPPTMHQQHLLAQGACRLVKSEDQIVYYYDSSCPGPSIEVIDADRAPFAAWRTTDGGSYSRALPLRGRDLASELRNRV